MNELFKNFKMGNQDVTSKNFTGHASVSFGGEITVMKGGLEQEVSYNALTYPMNIKGYVTFDDWDIQEHLSNVFNGLPIDNLHKFKATLMDSGLETLANSLSIHGNEMSKQIGLQLMKTPLFKKVYGKNAIMYDSLSKDEQQIVQLTHTLEGDNFEKASANSWVLKEYVTIDDGVKVKPDRSVVEIALSLLQEAQTKKD